jgi:hypothetical protein
MLGKECQKSAVTQFLILAEPAPDSDLDRVIYTISKSSVEMVIILSYQQIMPQSPTKVSKMADALKRCRVNILVKMW